MKLILTVILCCTIAGSVVAKTYATSHISGEDGWRLSIPSEAGSYLFIDPRLALEITQLTCDGVRIEANLTDARTAFDYDLYPSSNTGLIYSLRWDELTFAVRDASGKFSNSKLNIFKIPHDGKNIVVTYKVRFSDGASSEENVLMSEYGRSPASPKR